MNREGLSRKDGKGIEYCHYTWNPVAGCLRGCQYCYARRIAERFRGTPGFPHGFEPTFHPERINEPAKVKRPSVIFVGSMCDMAAPWTRLDWCTKTILQTRKASHHIYLWLTKEINQIIRIGYPDPLNCLFGRTITCQNDIGSREAQWDWLSIEPLLGPVDLSSIQTDWVVLGAQTGPGAVKPELQWINNICRQCLNRDIPVYLKRNLLKQYPSTAFRLIMEFHPAIARLLEERKD